MQILSIDPGKTTGLVIAKINDSGDIKLIQAVQIEWDDRFEVLRKYVVTAWPDVIVCEAFRLYASHAKAQVNNEFPSVRVIGALEAYAHDSVGIDRIHFQGAAVMSRVQVPDDDYIKAALRGKPHARDAFKHLRYYVVTNLV